MAQLSSDGVAPALSIGDLEGRTITRSEKRPCVQKEKAFVMSRPIYAEIDLNALRHNLARIRECAGDRDVWAVVKANAYGHGLENAVAAFADADGLATIDLCDAERARKSGWQKRILLLYTPPDRSTQPFSQFRRCWNRFRPRGRSHLCKASIYCHSADWCSNTLIQ